MPLQAWGFHPGSVGLVSWSLSQPSLASQPGRFGEPLGCAVCPVEVENVAARLGPLLSIYLSVL